MHPEQIPQNVPSTEQQVSTVSMREIAIEIEKKKEERKKVSADMSILPAIKEKFLTQIDKEINELTERGIDSLGSATQAQPSQEALDKKYAVGQVATQDEDPWGGDRDAQKGDQVRAQQKLRQDIVGNL